jgi:putative ABC transport system permease protein
MLKSYFILALRNFWKNKVFAFINVLGLSIGISAALVIYLIVAYDLGFDKFHKDGERIYRVVTDLKFPGQDFKNSGVPAPLPEAARKEVTGIELGAAFYLFNSDIKVTVPASGNSKEAVYKREANIVFADEYYFGLVPYKWLAGSAAALKQPHKVVLTKSRAEKYFGSAKDAGALIGRSLYFNDSIQTEVAGIVEDLPHRTDFSFKEFISMPTASQTNLKENFGFGEWGSITSSSQFVVKLSKGANPKQVEAQLKALRKKYVSDDVTTPSTTTTTHKLQPLANIHFNADYDNFDQRLANLSTLKGLMLVAVFLLVLGCINFINLTTAQASQRAKEIGVRKTMGSSKKQLVFQFLSETTLLTLIATIISVLITPWILKIFADFIPQGLTFNAFKETHILLFLALLVIVVSMLSGFYPALVLSRFRPVTVLKNQAYANTSKTRSTWIRKTLTVSQFVSAQVFIMATIVVGKQINYSLNKQLGYKKEAIVFFYAPWQRDQGKREVLRQKLKSIPGIQAVAAGAPPASRSTSSQTMTFINDGKETESTVEVKYADSAYFKMYGLKLLAGNWLRPSDTIAEYLINERYAKELGFKNPADAVGRLIGGGGDKKIPIVGVLADFHTKSTHVAIKPLAYSTNRQSSSGTYNIALDPAAGGAGWQQTLDRIRTEWKSIYPEDEFSYTFFDESIAEFYKSERNIARLLTWATGLAILISCLGLLGLVIYTTNQRVKEIGIRKVLGASITQLVSLLSKDFVRLVLLAFLVAAPLTWWGVYRWLEGFAYRTEISWWIFVLGGSIMMLIALFTLSIQIVRSAMANPVKNLRTE